MNAAEELAFFLDCFIDLYQNHKDVLRFIRNFETYIRHENVSKENLTVYKTAVDGFARKYHAIYQEAEKDDTLKLWLQETEPFPTIITPCCPPKHEKAMTEEMTFLKNMILRTYTNEKCFSILALRGLIFSPDVG